MSASLVGSEMCIRDRSWVCARAAGAVAGLCALPCVLVCAAPVACLRAACLLYTSDAADDM
eukprot:4713042-Alexandrium_andersonii.AAC.1